MQKLDALIEAVRADRAFFHLRYRETNNHGHAIEASACAIRERALLEARAAVLGRIDPGFELL